MRAHVREHARRPARRLSHDLEPTARSSTSASRSVLRTRLLSYFRCAFPEDKGARILREAERIEWEYTPSEFAALLEELRLIKRFRPRFNVAMKRDGRHLRFHQAHARAGAQAARRARRRRQDDASVYYGPFMGATRRRRSGARAERRARPARLRGRPADALRRSARAVPDLSAHAGLHPLRDQEVPRPVRRRLLGAAVRRARALARAFLDGADDGPIEQLRARDGASERAHWSSSARRCCATSSSGSRRCAGSSRGFRFAVETLSFVYTVPGHDGDDRVYLIRRGRVRAEIAAAEDAATMRRRSLGLIEEVFAPVERETGQIPTHEIDELLLLSSWFRAFPTSSSARAPRVPIAPLAAAS